MNSENQIRLFAGMVLWTVVFGTYDRAAAADPFTRQENVVYGEDFGVGLVMDIFTPTGEKNGLAIIDVVSGAWRSDRGKMRDHERAQMFHIYCSRGYTVFAVRPGSITKFSIPEMVKHIEQGIVWVKKHADEYGVDVSRIGMAGASAGGHLASLVAIRNESSDAQPGLDKATVKAVGVFFPPTDLTDYRGESAGESEKGESEKGVSAIAMKVLFPNGTVEDLTEEQIRQRLADISPALLVTKDAPPFLLIHGDADPLVPLEQSKRLQNALKEHGVSAELIVKAGGGHPWLTLHEEVAVMADWFDGQLKK